MTDLHSLAHDERGDSDPVAIPAPAPAPEGEEALRRTVQSLRLELARLRAAIDSLPDLIFFKDTAGVYLGCNRAVGQLLHMDPAAIVGKTDEELFPPAQADAFRAADRCILESGEPSRQEIWHQYPDGRRVLFDTLKVPYYGPDGELLGVLGNSRDITALRQAQETLLEAQAITHLGTWELDHERDRLHWSDETCRIFGLPPGTPMDLAGFFERVHPRDRERVEADFRRSVETGADYSIDHRILRPDGSVRWVRRCGRHRTDAQGQLARSLGTTYDLTEEHAAQALLEERTYQLGERVKELCLLYGILSVLAESEGDPADALARVVELMPSGWRFPSQAAAEILLNRAGEPCVRVATPDYQDTKRVQRATVRVGAEPCGQVSLAYLEPVPEHGAGPFLPEERDLIEAIALEIGRFLRRLDAERAAREGEAKYRTIVEAVQDGVWLLDLEGQLYFANPAAARLLGYPSTQALLQVHPGTLAPESQPDGRRSLDLYRENDRIALERGQHRFDWEMRRADGSTVPTEVTLIRVLDRGRPAILALVRDRSGPALAGADRASPPSG